MADETPTPTPTPNVPENGAGDPGDALRNASNMFDSVRQLLSAIVVHERYTITDVYDNKYEFRPVLAARRQIEAALRIDDFLKRRADPEMAEAAKGATGGGGFRAVLMYLQRAVMEPEIADDVEAIFRSIHPGILARAKLAAKEAGDQDDHLLDLFAIEEIFEALVPFFARFGTRTGEILGRLTGEKQGQTSSPASQSLH